MHIDWRDIDALATKVVSMTHSDLMKTEEYEFFQVLDHYMPVTITLDAIVDLQDWAHVDQIRLREISGCHLRLPYIAFEDVSALLYTSLELYRCLCERASKYRERFENLEGALEIINSFCFSRDVDECCDLMQEMDV